MAVACELLLFALMLAFMPTPLQAVEMHHRTIVNPIRKVVTMLQSMQQKVAEEGEKEEKLYHKYMCYCTEGRAQLEKSIEDGKEKTSSLETTIKEYKEKKTQTQQDLKQHEVDRSEAKEAMAKAKALRAKEAKAYETEHSETTANLNALKKAIPAIEKGMGSAFLQTPAAQTVRKLAIETADMSDLTRQDLLSFLSGQSNTDYDPQSGEIVGILKQMAEDMQKGLQSSEADEAAAVKDYEGLMAAKKKERTALDKQIEAEMVRVGDLGVELSSKETDLEDTIEAVKADSKFIAELKSGCGTKKQEWEHIKKMRSDELVALADTIKLLNDDDALELFKKTLPSPGSASAASAASFLQVKAKTNSKAKALRFVRSAHQHGHARPQLDLIALAIQGKQVGFDKVIQMVEDMTQNLMKEQKDDEKKKEYCEAELDKSDDKKKALQVSVSDSNAAIEDLKGSIETLVEEIQELEGSIKDLDNSVAKATAQRKEENAEYKVLMANNAAAKELMLFAKNRLNKFYNPKLYDKAPKRELSDEDSITAGLSGTMPPTPPPGGIAGTDIEATAFVQVTARHLHRFRQFQPSEPQGPAKFRARSTESTGVIEMIDLLITDLEKEMASADTLEKDAQSDYEKLMVDAAEKRSQDSKSITQKTVSKAQEEEAVEAEKDTRTATSEELQGMVDYIRSLHGECDWIMQHYDQRTAARNNEIDNLEKAKAVLSGAEYSFLQVSSSTAEKTKGFLRMQM